MEPFSLPEIEAALHSMESSKAPGPDGINGGVIKSLWNEVKGDYLQLFSDFYENGSLPKGISSSFIVLIPKIQNPISLSDFRPISLMNISPKLLSKVLAIRLKKVMGYMVSDDQSAFIKNRQMSDCIIITTEVFTALKAKKCRGVIMKLDFAKAFNTVNWNFVFHVLQMMNFDERWISWIKAMYKASKISVLVNGAPTDEFASSRGLRQGDSLSPLMFNLVGEVLSRLLVSANKNGIFRGITLPKCDIEFTHL